VPVAEVYLCDKTEGLKGNHRKCGREVGAGGVRLFLTVAAVQGKLDKDEPPDVRPFDLQFCGRVHANYWLIRQRVARSG